MVRVEPITKAWAEALARGDEIFSKYFGLPVELDWAGFPEVLSFIVEVACAVVPGQWGLHLVLDDDGALVGRNSMALAGSWPWRCTGAWPTALRLGGGAGQAVRAR